MVLRGFEGYRCESIMPLFKVSFEVTSLVNLRLFDLTFEQGYQLALIIVNDQIKVFLENED